MEIRIFERGDFPEYRSWYQDEVLSGALGPMDDEWLEAVLAESPPAQYSCWVDGELGAVVGIARGGAQDARWVVTDVAVRPDLRGRGLGRLALEGIFRIEGAERREWVAFVQAQNQGANQFFTTLGWRRSGPDESGLWVFERPKDRSSSGS